MLHTKIHGLVEIGLQFIFDLFQELIAKKMSFVCSGDLVYLSPVEVRQ
jgi:hypothetical protein